VRISRRQPPTRPTASEPHAFVDPPDPRLGLALGGSARGGSVMGMAGPAAITLYSLELDRCALPGCGKSHDDPIHWVAAVGEDPGDLLS